MKNITKKQLHKTLKNRGASKNEIKQIDDLEMEIVNMLRNYKVEDRFKL